jgi:nitroreductase
MNASPTAFLELARCRRSVRRYRPDPVHNDILLRCLEAARLAPSSCNSQPWTFIVVDDPELKNQVADLTADRFLPLNHFTKQAPVIVVVVVEKQNLSARFGAIAKDRPLAWIDMGAAVEHFCLQAAAEGVGSCILGWFKERPLKTLLQIPAGKRIGLLVTLGYPEGSLQRPKDRKDLAEMARCNTYQEPWTHD